MIHFREKPLENITTCFLRVKETGDLDFDDVFLLGYCTV
jgi:hypothetical protein